MALRFASEELASEQRMREAMCMEVQRAERLSLNGKAVIEGFEQVSQRQRSLLYLLSFVLAILMCFALPVVKPEPAADELSVSAVDGLHMAVSPSLAATDQALRHGNVASSVASLTPPVDTPAETPMKAFELANQAAVIPPRTQYIAEDRYQSFEDDALPVSSRTHYIVEDLYKNRTWMVLICIVLLLAVLNLLAELRRSQPQQGDGLITRAALCNRIWPQQGVLLQAIPDAPRRAEAADPSPSVSPLRSMPAERLKWRPELLASSKLAVRDASPAPSPAAKVFAAPTPGRKRLSNSSTESSDTVSDSISAASGTGDRRLRTKTTPMRRSDTPPPTDNTRKLRIRVV